MYFVFNFENWRARERWKNGRPTHGSRQDRYSRRDLFVISSRNKRTLVSKPTEQFKKIAVWEYCTDHPSKLLTKTSVGNKNKFLKPTAIPDRAKLFSSFFVCVCLTKSMLWNQIKKQQTNQFQLMTIIRSPQLVKFNFVSGRRNRMCDGLTIIERE